MRAAGDKVVCNSTPMLAGTLPCAKAQPRLVLPALQPLHQPLLVEGQEDEADDAADGPGADGDEEPVELEALLSQVRHLDTTGQISQCSIYIAKPAHALLDGHRWHATRCHRLFPTNELFGHVYKVRYTIFTPAHKQASLLRAWPVCGGSKLSKQ